MPTIIVIIEIETQMVLSCYVYSHIPFSLRNWNSSFYSE